MDIIRNADRSVTLKIIPTYLEQHTSSQVNTAFPVKFSYRMFDHKKDKIWKKKNILHEFTFNWPCIIFERRVLIV